MRLVSVSGTCSRAGKTALAETVLRALPPGAAAVKFTVTDDVFQRCPRGSRCVVCDIDVPFRVIDAPAILREPGTDTDRLAAAGAGRVVWVITRASAAERAWKAAQRLLEGSEVAVLEGSTIVEQGLARPEIRLFVAHRATPPERWKPTSPALVAASDLVVVHSETGRVSPAVLDALDAMGAAGRRVIADVTEPLRAWAPALEARLGALAAVPAAIDGGR